MVLYLHINNYRYLYQTPKGGIKLGSKIPDNNGIVVYSAIPFFYFMTFHYEESNCIS